MSPTMQMKPEQAIRRLLPERFKRLSEEQIKDLRELFDLYFVSFDQEVMDVILEILFPESLGEVIDDPGVLPEAAAKLDKAQAYIGDMIRKERVKRNWTQEELAQRAGIKQSHICRLEQGKHTPTDLTIKRIADALEVDPSLLDLGW
jgi:DNA-binding XRE family transcriptional regulator